MAYDGRGERVSKTVAGTTTLFTYDEGGHLQGEYGSTGTPIEETIWVGDVPVAVVKPTGTYYVHADHLNTPRQIDDSQGHPVWAWDTITFGASAPNQDPLNTGTPFVYNLRMPGQYYDAETGIFQNLNRDYDPSTGRYIQSDPIGLVGGLNTYAYVDGNPLGFIDPSGLASPGHHVIPRQVFNEYDLPPETAAEFEEATTGQVEHYFDWGHRRYNRAVREVFEEFLKKNKINPAKMTVQQAQQCIAEVKNSPRPEITEYLEFLKNGGGKFSAPELFEPFIICPTCFLFEQQLQDYQQFQQPGA